MRSASLTTVSQTGGTAPDSRVLCGHPADPPGRPGETSPRSRTDLNGSGCPHRNLRIGRLGECRTDGAFADRCDRAGYSMVPRLVVCQICAPPKVPAAFALVTALWARVCKTVG